MPLRPLDQTSFFDPEFVSPGCLEPGTVPWLLARQRSRLFPQWLLAGWRGEGPGRNAWPAAVLMTLVVLRWSEEGMSRRACERRARADVAWRAAMGISLDAAAPSERTMRDFERFLRRRHPDADMPRYLLLHEHFVRLCDKAGLVGQGAEWATDSTPMWCYGAVLDTVRLLGDGLRMLGRRWAQATRQSIPAVAESFGLPLLLAKSTKGALAVDWRDRDARANAASELAQAVLRVVGRVRDGIGEARRALRKPLLRLCKRLLRIVGDDLETDEAGRFVVAQRVAKDRLISLTDPQARHGRKSKSKTFNGFKVHVLGDLASGVLASLTVTAGSQHDQSVAHRLVRRAKGLFEDIRPLTRRSNRPLAANRTRMQ